MPGIPYPPGLPLPRTLTAVERDNRFERVTFDDGHSRQWPVYASPAAGLELVKPLQFLIPADQLNGWFVFMNAWGFQPEGIEILGLTVVLTSSPSLRWQSGDFYLVEVDARTAT